MSVSWSVDLLMNFYSYLVWFALFVIFVSTFFTPSFFIKGVFLHSLQFFSLSVCLALFLTATADLFKSLLFFPYTLLAFLCKVQDICHCLLRILHFFVFLHWLLFCIRGHSFSERLSSSIYQSLWILFNQQQTVQNISI